MSRFVILLWNAGVAEARGAARSWPYRSFMRPILLPQRSSTWSTGTVNSWAAQSYEVAKAHSYGKLSAPEADGHYVLSAAYVTDATTTERRQLRRAGVRLANVLNDALR